MNVFQMTQSFQSMVESIATTNPTDKYVTKDLYQNCMATVANNIIELVKSVNQLSWGLNAGLQNLADKLEKSEETAEISHAKNAKISQQIDRLDLNNIKVCNNIRELSEKVENMDKINRQNITMLSSRLHNLEESNSSIKDNIKDISDRLQITESDNKSLKLTTVELSEKVSRVYESVDNLHKSSSTIMSNYQNQQASIDSLTNIVTTLQEKSAQVISQSTPKPPPGLPHRNISNTPFFIPKPPPGFHTHAVMPLQREIFLPQADFCLEENQSGTTSSGEFSPVPFSSVPVTDICDEIPVSETDGNADSSQVFATPTKSTTVCPADSMATKVITPPVSNQVTLQSAETKLSFHSCAVNQSDHSFKSVPVSSNSCQSVESHSICSSLCDSGIASILDQTSHQPSPTNTLFTSPDKDRRIQTQIISHITSMSGVSRVKTGEECSKQTVNVYTCNSSHQSVLVEYADSTLSQHAPILTSGHSVPFPHSPSLPCIEGSDNVSSQSTVEICGDTFTSLIDKALSGDTSQFAVSPVKSFEQVRQSEGHKEYGRQHPVRRPWKLIYNTLRWLKPFK